VEAIADDGRVDGLANSESGVMPAGGAASRGVLDPSIADANAGCVVGSGVVAERVGALPVCSRRFQSWPVVEVEESARLAGWVAGPLGVVRSIGGATFCGAEAVASDGIVAGASDTSCTFFDPLKSTRETQITRIAASDPPMVRPNCTSLRIIVGLLSQFAA
jgi:hypothetical protein